MVYTRTLLIIVSQCYKIGDHQIHEDGAEFVWLFTMSQESVHITDHDVSTSTHKPVSVFNQAETLPGRIGAAQVNLSVHHV